MSTPFGEASETVKTFGGSVEAFGPDGCRIRYSYDPTLCNPKGSLQGGVLTVFLDDAMSYAVVGHMSLQVPFSTISMNVDFLVPVHGGDVIATGRVTRAGRRVLFLSGEIETEGGAIAARATGTAIVL